MIEVRNLSKSFGDVQAVNDISFDVRARRDLRVSRPERGRKDDDDQDAHDAAAPDGGVAGAGRLESLTHQNQVRQQFGIVFQDPSLDSELTAWENLMLHAVLYHVPRATRLTRAESLLSCSSSGSGGTRR